MKLFGRRGRSGATTAGHPPDHAAGAPGPVPVPRVAELHGQVATRDGWPAPGAVVTVLDDTGSQVARAVTDADGAFTTSAGRPGTLTVLVTGAAATPLVRSTTVSAGDNDLGRLVAGTGSTGGDRPTVGDWVIDPAHSVVRATARHLGMSRIEGRFTEVEGVIRITDPPEDSSVRVSIAASSITTGHDARDVHLRSADFLDVERFPELTFVSNSVRVRGDTTLEVVGELTIRETTRTVVLATELTGTGPDPWGGTRVALVARTELARRDYAMAWDMGLPGGLSMVGPTLRIDLDVQAVLRV